MALTAKGKLYSWGNNKNGQLGQGDAPEEVAKPACVLLCGSGVVDQQFSYMPRIKEVACGAAHTLILTTHGVVMACGDNSRGQLGLGTSVSLEESTTRFVPTYLEKKCEAKTVACGGYVSAVIDSEKTLWMWGCCLNMQMLAPHANAANDGDICGANAQKEAKTICPHELEHFAVEKISISHDHCVCIMAGDSSVWTWGRNSYGKLGNGTEIGHPVPVCVCTVAFLKSKASLVSAGGFHTLLLDASGYVWAAGSCQVGIGINKRAGECSSFATFQRVCVLDRARCAVRVIAIASGRTHSVLVTSDQHVMTCGRMQHPIAVCIPEHLTRPHYGRGLAKQYTIEQPDISKGFGGLGLSSALAVDGCVNQFHLVRQLQTKMAFQSQFSIHTRSKIQYVAIAVYFDTNETRKKATRPEFRMDRQHMNQVPSEVLDLIFQHIRCW
jgi:alpha-tubulin suppressor-like RCC1 family protein